MLPLSGDIRDQSLKWSKIDRNFACFWPQIFLGEHIPNFWSQFIKYSQIPIMWQSFREIGRRISEEAWWIKKENVTGKTEARPELIVPGGLIIHHYSLTTSLWPPVYLRCRIYQTKNSRNNFISYYNNFTNMPNKKSLGNAALGTWGEVMTKDLKLEVKA